MYIMKKLVLLSACALFAVAGNAQRVTNTNERVLVPSKAMTLNVGKKEASFDGTLQKSFNVKAPAKVATKALYYTRPAGTFYSGSTIDGQGYYVNFLLVPPAFDLWFMNRSNNPSKTQWTINGQDASDFVKNNSFHFGETPSYFAGFYTPVLHSGNSTYQLGQDGRYFDKQNFSAFRIDSITSNAPYDERTGQTYGFGAVHHVNAPGDTVKYCIGTGSVNFKEDGELFNSGAIQYMPKPASPFYVENIFSLVYTSSQPLTGDAYMDLYVLAARQTAEGFEATGDTIARLKAVAQDQVKWMEPTNTVYGKVAGYTVVFKPVDADGNEADAFVINQPYAIYMKGFQNPGVNVDVMAGDEAAVDSANVGCTLVWSKKDGEVVGAQNIYGTSVLSFCFTGFFDYCEVTDTLYAQDQQGNITETYPNANVLYYGTDGKLDAKKTVSSEGVYVSAVRGWYDSEGGDNYWIDNIPEWVGDPEVTEDPEDHVFKLSFPNVKALPAGTTKRAARLWVQGLGYDAQHPIVILQGDADIPDGIDNVTINSNKQSDNRIFNLNGQQVSKAYKGIVVKNGRKMLNK